MSEEIRTEDGGTGFQESNGALAQCQTGHHPRPLYNQESLSFKSQPRREGSCQMLAGGVEGLKCLRCRLLQLKQEVAVSEVTSD